MRYVDIPGYYWLYRIGEDAKVERQHKNGKWCELKPFISKVVSRGQGRLCVQLRLSDGRYRNVKVKRLMAEAFMPGWKPGDVVGFRNGMVTDCAIENLFFSTRKELSRRTGGSSRRPVEKLDGDGNVVEVYSSVTEAAKKNFISKSALCARCKNKIADPSRLDGFFYRYG